MHARMCVCLIVCMCLCVCLYVVCIKVYMCTYSFIHSNACMHVCRYCRGAEIYSHIRGHFSYDRPITQKMKKNTYVLVFTYVLLYIHKGNIKGTGLSPKILL